MLSEMAAAAADLGLDVIAITEHDPSMEGAPHAGFFDMSWRLPRRIGAVTVLYGAETNILDRVGDIDLPSELAPLPASSRLTNASPIGSRMIPWPSTMAS
jgi:putative hydrolase